MIRSARVLANPATFIADSSLDGSCKLAIVSHPFILGLEKKVDLRFLNAALELASVVFWDNIVDTTASVMESRIPQDSKSVLRRSSFFSTTCGCNLARDSVTYKHSCGVGLTFFWVLFGKDDDTVEGGGDDTMWSGIQFNVAAVVTGG